MASMKDRQQAPHKKNLRPITTTSVKINNAILVEAKRRKVLGWVAQTRRTESCAMRSRWVQLENIRCMPAPLQSADPGIKGDARHSQVAHLRMRCSPTLRLRAACAGRTPLNISFAIPPPGRARDVEKETHGGVVVLLLSCPDHVQS